ncbi:acyltransferase family protein [Bradyrhizobium sp. DASA03076]|uniref:acyltransferase family protein n=1 Tax=Bradyrhizobium sp. BLXBL-03 TaxID=3395916 RepID=UPI003F6F1B24
MNVDSVARQHIGYLDGWRGMAVLSLLLGHFTPVHFLGQFGVEAFFVLSGRLMADILFLRKLDLPTFFFRRASRIWPALLSFATCIFAICLIARHLGYSSESLVRLGDFQASIFFYMNYWIGSHHETVLAHTWSIAVEEHGYFLLAIVAFVTRRSGRTAAIALIILSVCCMINGTIGSLSGGGLHDLYWRSDVRLSSILVPAALFLSLTLDEKQQLWVASGWIPVGTFFVALVLHTGVFPDWMRYTLGTLCLGISVNSLQSAPNFVKVAIESRWLGALGVLSFSIYLWQQPFALLAGKLSLPFTLPLLGAAVLVGVMSFYFLENPARRLLNRAWTGRVKSAGAEVSGVAQASPREI